MAPNYTMFPNPIELRTHTAARVLGKLIALWTADPATRPADAKPDTSGRLLVMSADSFHAVLAQGIDGLTLDETDYSLRGDITEVELILRAPGRLSFLLPEVDAIATQEGTRGPGGLVPGLKMPSINTGVQGSGAWMHIDSGHGVMSQVKFDGDDALDGFLYPYMAGYMCAQCT